MRNKGISPEPLLPEWSEGGTTEEDAAWVEALEASRREQFAELEDL